MDKLQGLSRVGDLVRRSADRFPDLIALQDGALRWRYRELLSAMDDTRRELAELSIRAGDRVLIVAENCAEQVVLLFAVSELDAWPVLVSGRLAGEEIDRILGHCTPRLALLLSKSSPGAAQHAQRICAIQSKIEGLGAMHVWQPSSEPRPEPIDERVDQRIAAMIYTSGSTGVPKGAMLSHANLLFIGLMQAEVRHYVPGDKIYCVVPIAHVGGLASVLMGIFAAGGCVSLVQRFSAPGLGQMLREDDISILAGLPTLYVKFLEWARANPEQFAKPKLRMLTCASSPLDPAVKSDVEALFDLPLMNGYGMTETAAVACQTEFNHKRNDVSVGSPLPGVEVRFADDDGYDVAEGEVGEILVRGPNVFPGYYRNPQATSATFSADGWFKTGDLGHRDSNGDVFISGRLKDTIKRSGYNIYPIDVETALNAHPDVAISAVVGRPRDADEEVVAFVQLNENSAIGPEQIIGFLAQRLASYKLPNVLEVLPQLPTLHNGKVDKTAVRQLAIDLRNRNSQ